MKKLWNSQLTVLIISLLLILPMVSNGQSDKSFIKKYLSELPSVKVSNVLTKYRMTAVYTNRDLYGKFMDKKKITGDYTRGLENGLVSWNNIFISSSSDFSKPFPSGSKQEYMENFKYIPSSKMLDAVAFKDFPQGPETVFAKNLVWDMMGIEFFAWDFKDSLKLNKIYRITGPANDFAMADIGSYSHTEIQLCWTGISEVKDVMCAIIEFRAIDNKIEMNMDALKTKGTEQYWGTVWVSLTDRLIEHAEMYGGTMQEIEISGMENKFLVKTIRELWVDKIQ